MSVRDDMMALLHYRQPKHLPVIHFGFWEETLEKWYEEGHLSRREAEEWVDCNGEDLSISKKLGFDSNWGLVVGAEHRIFPYFEERVIEKLEGGRYKKLNQNGVIILDSDDNQSIPCEVDHLLKNRSDWEVEYRHRFQYSPERLTSVQLDLHGQKMPLIPDGLDLLKEPEGREFPISLFVGSLMGQIRDILGLENMSYLMVDDYNLLVEIIDTVADLEYQLCSDLLSRGAVFDMANYWEDICYKNGPLISPDFFARHVGPHYKRINTLLAEYGIDIVTLDCDGKIDLLLPIWLENGVNTMFPIEVGTWNASIEPWRKQYGRELRGIGGMRKECFAMGREAIDREIERLKPLIELGGFIPCPDHRIAPNAEWDTVRYYCDQVRELSDRLEYSF